MVLSDPYKPRNSLGLGDTPDDVARAERAPCTEPVRTGILRRQIGEENISTEPARAQAAARVSGAQSDGWRSAGAGPQTAPRAQAAVCLRAAQFLVLTAWQCMEAIASEPVELGKLRRRADFLRVQAGPKWAAPGLVLHIRDRAGRQADSPTGETPVARFGYTATKRLGGAVVRNRMRRRLREAVRLVAPQAARAGQDYVLIARKATLRRPFRSLVEDLATAFERVHNAASRSGRSARAATPGSDRSSR